MKIIEPERCPRCGASFHCSKSSRCWCYGVSIELSVLDKLHDTYNSCLCPECLEEFSAGKGLKDNFANLSK